MNMKRTIFVLLIMTMIISVIGGSTGCTPISTTASTTKATTGGATTSATTTSAIPAYVNLTGMPITKQPITLSVMIINNANVKDYQDLWLVKYMKKLSNIALDFRITDSQAWAEKKTLVLASAELPDLVWGSISPLEEVKYGVETGIFVPMNKYFTTYAPNILAFDKTVPDLLREHTCIDGNIYGLGNTTTRVTEVGANPRFWYNKQWATELGFGSPKTLDDVYAILKAFRDKDPNIIALAGGSTASTFEGFFLNAFGMNPGLGSTQNRLSLENGKWVYSPLMTQYKDYLIFMNKLWNEKIIDPEFATRKDTEINALGAQMRLGMVASGAHFIFTGADKAKWSQYAAVPAVSTTFNPKADYYRNSLVQGTCLVMTKANKYPEATIRWIDYFYSFEGNRDFWFGPEYGTDPAYTTGWKWTDSSKTQWEYAGMPEGLTWWGLLNSKLNTGAGYFVPRPMAFELQWKTAESELDFQKSLDIAYLKNMTKIRYQNIYFTKAEQDVLVTDELEKYVREMEVKFILGMNPLTDFDKFTAEIKKRNIDKLLEIYNTAYTRQMSKK